jgi:hypothetical protein
MTVTTEYQWRTQPEAAGFVADTFQDLLRRSPEGTRFAKRLLSECGVRLLDCLDHLVVSAARLEDISLLELGFERKGDATAYWVHPDGMFPRLVVSESEQESIGIKVDSVVDFLASHRVWDTSIAGAPYSSLRQATVWRGEGMCVKVVERHGDLGFAPGQAAPEFLAALARHSEAFRLRKRDFATASEGFAHAERLVLAATKELGRDRACDLFFMAERENWQRRNLAGRIQKLRQDALGIGWANHDHHTYRSSREHFHRLIFLLRLLGFETREQFYAGEEAGWGAQVLHQPHCGLLVFADVDLAPDEVAIDFASHVLEPSSRLGTVGLWCKLHGEAMLEAGLHHLECQFDFDEARRQLSENHVGSMSPFTDFPYLKQCFTAGERWPVRDERLRAALAEGHISSEEAERFRRDGAIGSHLEILERNDGYKGFNQTGVSHIISETNPRTAVSAGNP